MKTEQTGAVAGHTAAPLAAISDQELWELRKRGKLVEPVPCKPTRDLAVQTARNTPLTDAQASRLWAGVGGVTGEWLVPAALSKQIEKSLQRSELVAQAAEALFHSNQLEAGAVEMNRRWKALEQALNEWRAGK